MNKKYQIQKKRSKLVRRLFNINIFSCRMNERFGKPTEINDSANAPNFFRPIYLFGSEEDDIKLEF